MHKEYYEKNKDKIQKYYEKNKDKIQEYYENNKDKINATTTGIDANQKISSGNIFIL